MDTFLAALPTFRTEANALAAMMNAVGSGAAFSMPYTFSTTTTDADPGAGILRLSSATQNTSAVIRMDLLDSSAADRSGSIALFDDSTSAVKGYITLFNATDTTKWLLFSISAIASPSGYRNVTVTCAASSEANPFANADSLLLNFTPNGDKGDTGATGAAGTNGTNGTDGQGVPQQVTNLTSANVTLTTTPTLVKCAHTSYGFRITAPDATTMSSVGGPFYVIDNSTGIYPVLFCDSTGTIKAFVYAGIVAQVSLSSLSTAAGVWAVNGGEFTGASARLSSTSVASAYSVVALDSDRDFILSTNGSNHSTGVVYRKSTNAFGAVATIRAAVVSSFQAAILQGTNAVLVVSCTTGSTAMEAVICSVNASTDAITPNTAATATLAANILALGTGCELTNVGGSFVFPYTITGTYFELRALSVSGATVTIGPASRQASQNNNSESVKIGYSGSGSVVIAASSSHAGAGGTGYVYVTPYTVGGSTLTLGTGATITTGAANQSAVQKLALLGSGRWYMSHNMANGSLNYDNIVSLSGTTVTVSTVVRATATAICADAILVASSSTKVLVLTEPTSLNANIVTDSAGTCSAGTAITLSSNATRVCAYADTSNVVVYDGATSSGSTYAILVDCSGASPVLTRAQLLTSTGSWGGLNASGPTLLKAANHLVGSQFLQRLWTGHNNSSQQDAIRLYGLGSASVRKFIELNGQGTSYRGKVDSERWVADGSSIYKWECVA
jgi:hypothetical protein